MTDCGELSDGSVGKSLRRLTAHRRGDIDGELFGLVIGKLCGGWGHLSIIRIGHDGAVAKRPVALVSGDRHVRGRLDASANLGKWQ